MSISRSIATLSVAIALLCLGGGGPATAADPAQAAARAAQERYGGRILTVKPDGDGFRVKLLQDSGKVKVVRVPAPDATEKPPGKGRSSKPRESHPQRWTP